MALLIMKLQEKHFSHCLYIFVFSIVLLRGSWHLTSNVDYQKGGREKTGYKGIKLLCCCAAFIDVH